MALDDRREIRVERGNVSDRRREPVGVQRGQRPIRAAPPG